MQKPQESSWPRVAGEGATIVVGILLAFSIDAWWDERSLRIEEQQILQGLREEFITVRNVLSDHQTRHLADLQDLEDFVIAAETETPEGAGPIVDAAVRVLLSPMTSDLGSGTLAALLSSGRIEILSNRVLRKDLAAWEGLIGEVWDDQALNAKAVFEIHIPYFLAENIPAGAAMHQWHDDWPLPRKSLSDDPDLVTRLIRDEKLRGIIEFQYGYKSHTSVEFQNALDAVDAILAQIESSLPEN